MGIVLDSPVTFVPGSVRQLGVVLVQHSFQEGVFPNYGNNSFKEQVPGTVLTTCSLDLFPLISRVESGLLQFDVVLVCSCSCVPRKSVTRGSHQAQHSQTDEARSRSTIMKAVDWSKARDFGDRCA